MKWKCRHDRLRGVYGDEINMHRGARSQCLDCGRFFQALPEERPVPERHGVKLVPYDQGDDW